MSMKKLVAVICLCFFIVACSATSQQVKQDTVLIEKKTASLIRLGDSMARSGDYASALGFYQTAHEDQPDIALPLIKQATLFLQMNDIKNAGEKLKKAAYAEPNNPEVAITYARFLMDNDLSEAPRFLSEAANRFKVARFYNWLGVAYDLNGAHDMAQKAYQTGLKREPNNVSVLNNYGLSLAVTGLAIESYQAFRKTIELEPDNILYRRNLAIAQILNGNQDAARFSLQEVLPENEIEDLVKTYDGLLQKQSPLDVLNKINHS